mmetsp:Transcript_18420/g.27525  ORF Transcript_18420/g.27525 Transcript_18420/m.27525 type:complete len:88 (+) Transcript_18420:233-496(+)
MYTFDAGGDFLRLTVRSTPRAISSMVVWDTPAFGSRNVVAGTVIKLADMFVAAAAGGGDATTASDGAPAPPAASSGPPCCCCCSLFL